MNTSTCLHCQDTGWCMEQMQLFTVDGAITYVPVLTQCTCEIGKQQCRVTRDGLEKEVDSYVPL